MKKKYKKIIARITAFQVASILGLLSIILFMCNHIMIHVAVNMFLVPLMLSVLTVVVFACAININKLIK